MHVQRLKNLYASQQYHILPIKSGMSLELHEKVGEGENTRVQKFKGLVIQVKKPGHIDGTFTIRGTVAGIVVERIFPLSFPKFEKVILLDQFQTRRARINYIRTKVGKGAKMKSLIVAADKEKDLLAVAKGAVASVAVQEMPAVQEEVVTETPTTPAVETPTEETSAE